MSRVRGHALAGEGSTYDAFGVRIQAGWYVTTGGYGRALCECGWLSDPLNSAAQRKAAHREHKAAVVAGGSP